MTTKLKITPSRNPNYKKGQVLIGDRFMSLRSDEQFQLANHLLTSEEGVSLQESPATKQERESKLRSMRVRSTEDLDNKVFAFHKGLVPAASIKLNQAAKVFYSCPDITASVKRSRRHIAVSPERILDAPGLRDDFYTSLTDWSRANVIAIALGFAIYLWDANKGEAEMLVDFEHDEAFPTLVKWSQEGKFLSIGLSNGNLKIFDVARQQCLRTICVQKQRVGCAGWLRNGVLSCGARNGRIFHHDVRERHSLISTFHSHSHEVCGLKWSDDERYLTSGGADARVNVWDRSQISSNYPTTLWTFGDHTAPVKAIEYVPFIGFGSNIVATGGGTRDHTVRLWNLNNGQNIFSQDTSSQVTGILFNNSFKEMVTGHGNPHSGVRVWRYRAEGGFAHVADLRSHGGRVLGLSKSPDGSYVMSSCEDETMRLWCCWKDDISSSSDSSKVNPNPCAPSLNRSSAVSRIR